MRGEQARPDPRACLENGSSPHARGTASRRPLRQGRPRIIPACAGNSARDIAAGDAFADHPRMRGEQRGSSSEPAKSSGSSPHARGTGHRPRAASAFRRIIPACAGNSGRYSTRSSRSSDHPRMRGEQGLPAILKANPGGSSPHARGTGPAVTRAGAGSRIIPACAGNRQSRSGSRHRGADHPRLRGEQDPGGRHLTLQSGSSPHARGTDAIRAHPAASKRIIPACAGNSDQMNAAINDDPDHPRMRGEQACV